ncbi:MAG TPA: hypothetical protein ENK57_25715 [Polyangiaceae bacterium]|nr:hypothetical protein [Polyangiaceae bacterium]
MQHAQLIGGIRRVSEALETSALREALNPRDELPADVLLDALRRYAIEAAGFTSTEETVADLLGLSELENTSVWARLLADDRAREHFYDRVGFVTHHLPRFVELLEESRQAPDDRLSICVTVVGDGHHGLSTSRVVTVINSLAHLHAAVRAIHGLVEAELSLVSMDAGEDTQLWFDGELEGLMHLKDLLIKAFRWLALYREEELEQRLERARDSLPTIAYIRELAADGTLDPDEAMQLEHDLLLALLAFFDAGAIIPEMERDHQQPPREIVTPPPPAAQKIAMQNVAAEIEELPESPNYDQSIPPRPGSEAELEMETMRPKELPEGHPDAEPLPPPTRAYGEEEGPMVVAEPLDDAEMVEIEELELVDDEEFTDFTEEP